MALNYVWDWFMDALNIFGLYNRNKKILFTGLDNSGKTTLIYMLKDGKMSTHEPTCHPLSEDFVLDGMSFQVYDLVIRGEHPQKVWKDYFPALDGLVFVIDAADQKRFMETKRLLNELLVSEHVASSCMPILLLGNKTDKPTAASENELRSFFKIQSTGKEHVPLKSLGTSPPIELFMCSCVKKRGYLEGFRWLSRYL